nr:uncharacterized protein cfap97d2 isoform X2 [Misgurnus anguillicaudatus]
MQHQAYQPILPSVNKYLQYRWDRNCYEIHRTKLEDERVSRIKRENHMLLEKMAHIMQTAGGVDCKNDYVIKSLGKEKRQMELLHITKENQRILQRLCTCRPHYNIQTWHNQWLKNIELMENIARYPRQYTQGSYLPPISTDRHGSVVHDGAKIKYTARHVHEDSASMMNEKEECDEEAKSEIKITSEDEA